MSSARNRTLCPECHLNEIDGSRSKQCKQCYINSKIVNAKGTRRGYGKLVPCQQCNGKHNKREKSAMCIYCTRRAKANLKFKFRKGRHAPDNVFCIDCGVDLNDDNWHKGERRNGRRRCVSCTRKHQREYYAKVSKKIAEKYLNVKLDIIRNYGGKCVCCGEQEVAFLTIDHINGNGKKHRESIGSGVNFYYWLKRMGYPKDNFQLMCMNCNFAKGKWPGGCPHQQRQQEAA